MHMDRSVLVLPPQHCQGAFQVVPAFMVTLCHCFFSIDCRSRPFELPVQGAARPSQGPVVTLTLPAGFRGLAGIS